MTSPDGGQSLRPLLAAAKELAEAAGRLTLRHFGEIVRADSKSDGTPVTIADREAETFLRDEIERRFPGHGILGEEFGEKEGSEAVRWILDPIDGTKSFMRGVPLYAVLIGIEVEGEPLVGVAHFPPLAETVAAARGLGCSWKRGSREEPAQVSEMSDLARAVALTTDSHAALNSAVGKGWEELTSRVAFSRSWGDAYGHILVATGRAEIMVDPVLSAWDAAPLHPILLEAGGRFTSVQGKETIHGGSGVSTNGHLHTSVLELLRMKAG